MMVAAYSTVGLPLSFSPQHIILIGPTDTIHFVCMVAVGKYFHMLTMWGEVWPEIYQISYRYLLSATKYHNSLK